MPKSKEFTYKNKGTFELPEYEQYFIKTLAECILMEDSAQSINIKEYVDQSISDLVNGAPEQLDTLKELAEAIAESGDLLELLRQSVNNKADKTDTIFSNATPTVEPHGGIPAGTTFNNVPIKSILNSILYPYIKPVVTTVMVPDGGVYEKGSNQTVTKVSVTITKKSNDITKVTLVDSDVIDSKQGNDLSGINTTGQGTLVFNTNISVSEGWGLNVLVQDSSETTNNYQPKTFSFVYPYYYGVISSNITSSNINISNLNKLIEKKGTKTIQYNASDQKLVFASPVSYGAISSIKDPNGFNILNTFERTTISITGLDGTSQNYYLYISDPTTVSSFNIVFSH